MMEEQALILPKNRYNTAIIICGIIIAVLLDMLLYVLVPGKGMSATERWFISRLACWTTLPFLYLYSVKVEGRDFLLWKERSYRTYFYIAAVAILLLITSFIQVISNIPHYLKFNDNYIEMRYVTTLMRRNRMLFVFTCITAGITEELTIRGYVLPRLSLLFKSEYIPILISAFLFSFIHFGYYNLSEIIFTFTFGLVSALFYHKYRNIKMLMIFHFLYDLVINL